MPECGHRLNLISNPKTEIAQFKMIIKQIVGSRIGLVGHSQVIVGIAEIEPRRYIVRVHLQMLLVALDGGAISLLGKE